MAENSNLENICQQIESLKLDEIFIILMRIEKNVSERMALNEDN